MRAAISEACSSEPILGLRLGRLRFQPGTRYLVKLGAERRRGVKFAFLEFAAIDGREAHRG